jgi:four helix bundle protein
MQATTGNLIVDKSFLFAVEIVRFCETLEQMRKYVVSRQLLKSGTSIDANVREALSAESRADFIHKLKISAKECEETKYWLMLCNASENYPNCFDLINFCDELSLILTKIISSARKGR